MASSFAQRGLVAALALAFCGFAAAATVPKGVQLHDKQELTRNNGSEPETLAVCRTFEV